MKIKVKVQPNSKIQKIQPMSEDEYKVFLRKSATENKANMELIKVMTKYFKKKATIEKGFTSKKKTLEIQDGN